MLKQPMNQKRHDGTTRGKSFKRRTGGALMSLQLVSLKQLRELIREQIGMPDLYDVTSQGAHAVTVLRDNYNGMDSLVQHMATCFGMNRTHLNLLDERLGWVCVTQSPPQ
jgi:hypothetical protein